MFVLFLSGLFDFDDHVGEAPGVVGRAYDFCAGGLVFVVGEGGECTGVVLDEDFVAGLSEGVDAGGGEGYAGLVVFDFLGDADDHVVILNATAKAENGEKGAEGGQERLLEDEFGALERMPGAKAAMIV